MHPLKHVLLTLTVSLPAAVLLGGMGIVESLAFGIIAVFGNLMIDAVDHPLIIFLGKERLAIRTRTLILSGRFREAFKSYYAGRKAGIKQVRLHTLPCFYASIVVSLVSVLTLGVWHPVSAFLCFGTLTHYLQDLFEDVVLAQNRKLWLKG